MFNFPFLTKPEKYVSSLSLTLGTNLFGGDEPEIPYNTVTVFDTPGRLPDLLLDNSETYDRPSIQVRVRNTSYVTGFNLANDIKDVLHGCHGVTLNGSIYLLIRCTNTPFMLDMTEGETKCFRFVANFELNRQEA